MKGYAQQSLGEYYGIEWDTGTMQIYRVYGYLLNKVGYIMPYCVMKSLVTEYFNITLDDAYC